MPTQTREQLLRCITCGHLMSVHLATRGRCLSLNAVEGGSVPCACTAFVVDMMDALRADAPAAPPQEDQ